jgi:hypothetical protein
MKLDTVTLKINTTHTFCHWERFAHAAETDVRRLYAVCDDNSDDSDLLSPNLNCDQSRKEGLFGQPKPGVDSNVSAWSRLSAAAVHTAVSPGFCTPTRRFQD